MKDVVRETIVRAEAYSDGRDHGLTVEPTSDDFRQVGATTTVLTDLDYATASTVLTKAALRELPSSKIEQLAVGSEEPDSVWVVYNQAHNAGIKDGINKRLYALGMRPVAVGSKPGQPQSKTSEQLPWSLFITVAKPAHIIVQNFLTGNQEVITAMLNQRRYSDFLSAIIEMEDIVSLMNPADQARGREAISRYKGWLDHYDLALHRRGIKIDPTVSASPEPIMVVHKGYREKPEYVSGKRKQQIIEEAKAARLAQEKIRRKRREQIQQALPHLDIKPVKPKARPIPVSVPETTVATPQTLARAVRTKEDTLYRECNRVAPNCYKVLGVPSDADLITIKRAYRRLVMKYHPDRCQLPDANKLITAINAAYTILSDPNKRKRYDKQLGTIWTIKGLQGLGELKESEGSEKHDIYLIGLLRQLRERHRPTNRDLVILSALAANQDKIAKTWPGILTDKPPRLLGCGYYGCAFDTTNPGTILKITTDDDEAQVGAAICERGSYDTCAVLPRIYAVRRYKGLTYILREKLGDLPSQEHRDYWDNCGTDEPCKVYGWHCGSWQTYCTYDKWKDTPCATRYKEVGKFARRLVKLCRTPGTNIRDLNPSNIGIRPSTGEWVIRDLGQSSYGPKIYYPEDLLEGRLDTIRERVRGYTSRLPKWWPWAVAGGAVTLGIGILAFSKRKQIAKGVEYVVQSIKDLLPVRGSDTVSDEFKAKTIRIAEELGMNPNHLMAVMAFESKLDPSIRNRIGATGLIQFLGPAAAEVGTTLEALAQMSGVEQLDYVEKYFARRTRQAGKPLTTLIDVYMAVLWPAAMGKGPDYVLFREGQRAYAANKPLDRDKKGYVTAADAASYPQAILDAAKKKAGVV